MKIITNSETDKHTDPETRLLGRQMNRQAEKGTEREQTGILSKIEPKNLGA